MGIVVINRGAAVGRDPRRELNRRLRALTDHTARPPIGLAHLITAAVAGGLTRRVGHPVTILLAEVGHGMEARIFGVLADIGITLLLFYRG